MRAYHAIIVLAICGGIGAAIAIGLASSPPPSSTTANAKPAATSQSGTAIHLARSRPLPGNTEHAPAVEQHEAEAPAPLPPPSSVVRSPIWVEPAPLRAEQHPTEISPENLQKALKALLGQSPQAEAAKQLELLPPAAAQQANPLPAQQAAPQQQQAAPTNEPKKSQIATTGQGADGQVRLNLQFADEDIHLVLDALAVQGNLNILASKNVSGKVTARMSNVDLDTALAGILRSTGYIARRDASFVYVGTSEDFNTMEQSMDRVSTRVYRPNYVTAAELQALIAPLVTEKVGMVSVSTPAEAGISSDAGGSGGGGGAAGAAGGGGNGGNKFAGGDVVLVRDYEAVLAQIDQVVAEIDVRPLQVAIEAMILSVKLDDKDQFGVDFQFLRNKDNVKFGIGNPPSSLANFKFEDGALKFGFLDSSLGAFISALETIGDINVIATPRVMVLNKQKADILIGEQLGYVSTTMTETASTQSVSFLEVGAQLRLRPYISADGLIRMEVHPELSTGAVKIDSGFTLPNKEVTQVTSNIMVRDGCTVVIGGLMRDEMETTAQQVPYLGNIPWVGALFRHKTEHLRRREIIVLITPHIVYDAETCQEGDQAACEFHRRQATYADKMTPLGKRSVGRRYFRMAQNALAAGHRDKALRFAELSVQFDPLNRAAIELRSQIWQGHEAAEAPTAPSPAEVLSPQALDQSQLPDSFLGQLEREPVPAPVAAHPLDPGQPGGHRPIERPKRLQ